MRRKDLGTAEVTSPTLIRSGYSVGFLFTFTSEGKSRASYRLAYLHRKNFLTASNNLPKSTHAEYI